jgi:hypothetical protein
VLAVNQGSKLRNQHFGSRKNLDRPFVEDAWRRPKAIGDSRDRGNRSEDPARIPKGRMLGFNLGC